LHLLAKQNGPESVALIIAGDKLFLRVCAVKVDTSRQHTEIADKIRPQIEQTILQSIEANLGVALLPEQVKKLPLPPDVMFRPLIPTITTESCIAWKAENPSAALKAYTRIVSDHCTAPSKRDPGLDRGSTLTRRCIDPAGNLPESLICAR
jgi:hypothetical protein